MKREIKLWDREGLAAIHFIHQIERSMMNGTYDNHDQKYREASSVVQIIREWLADHGYSIRLFIDDNCTGVMTYSQMFIGNISRFNEMEWCPVNFADCKGFAEFLQVPFEKGPDVKSVCTLEMEHFRLTISLQNSQDTHNPEFPERNKKLNPPELPADRFN